METNNLILIGLLVLLGIVLAMTFNSYYIENRAIVDPNPFYTEETFKASATSQLERDVIKWREYIRPYYYYNRSNMYKALNLETLKKEGGVCRHYAAWYIDLAKKDGYWYAIKDRMEFEDGSAHVVAKVTNVENDTYAYCYIDQMHYWCIEGV